MRCHGIHTLLAASVLLGAASCSEQLPPGPRPTAVTPASGANTDPVEVVFTGDRFEPHVTVDYDESGKSRIDDQFTARLDVHDLARVVWISSTELRAVVPAGLPPGVHDLTVVDPRGDRGSLAAAYTVLGPLDGGTDTAADGPPGDLPLNDAATLDGPPPFDGPPSPDTQAPPDGPVVITDLGPCPAVCSSCSGDTCKLPCASGCTCPAGWSCDIDCWAKICVGDIDCSAAKDCDLKCASTSCTGTVICGTGRCDVTCASGSCSGGVDCSKSCACSVSCASGSCGTGVTCPPFCNNKCTAADGCDQCP